MQIRNFGLPDIWLFSMYLYTVYMQKKIISFEKLFWLKILPPTPFVGLELTQESGYYESPIFFLT